MFYLSCQKRLQHMDSRLRGNDKGKQDDKKKENCNIIQYY